MAAAQCPTIRSVLYKIGGLVEVSVRRVVVAMSQSYPFADLFARVWSNRRAVVVPRPWPAAVPTR